MRKRILINASSAKMGGALTYLQNLAEGLSGQESFFEFIFIIPGKSTIFKKTQTKYRVILCPNNSWLGQLYFDQVVVRKIIKKEKIDVLFSTANFATIFCPCKQILLVRMAHYFPNIYLKNIHKHYRIDEKIGLFFRKILAVISIKRADLVMLPSRSFYEDVVPAVKVPENKVIINHYGANISKFFYRNREIYKNMVIKFLFFSLYSDYKNLTTLLKALILLKEGGFSSWEFIMPVNLEKSLYKNVSTYNEDLKLINNEKIKNNLKFIGEVSYNAAPSIYNDSDIFIWPTLAETFGHPLVEAMASGLPIISSDLPVNREIANGAALYFKPLDPNDLCDKIKSIINNNELRNNLIEIGKKQVLKFKWENHINKLIDVFSRI